MIPFSPASSAEHERLSTASPGSSQRSSSLSPAPKPYDPIKKPRKRRGKVVSVLRERYAFDANEDDEKVAYQVVPSHAVHVISPLSTGSLMERAEMRFALNHHLITLAWQTIENLNFPLWTDLSNALDNLRTTLSHGSSSLTTEVQVAALVCLAARKSNHSAITGLSEWEQRSGSGQVAPVGLGRRREQACIALLQRAIDLSEQAGAFKNATKDSIQSLSLLRMAVMASAPRHQVMIDIVDSLRGHYLAGVGSDPADSVVASDAGSALIFGRPLSLSEGELAAFGWPNLDVEELQRKIDALAFGRTFDEGTMLQMRGFVVHIMRKLASYQNRGWARDSVDPLPLPARPVFHELTTLATSMEKAIIALQRTPPITTSPIFAKLITNNQMYKLPIFFHSAIIKLAQELVKARVDPDGQNLLDEVQVRYLAWLRLFIQSCSWKNQSNSDILSQSLIVDGLELLPTWFELAIEGARQTAAGKGPLIRSGFSWDDLRELHSLLKISSRVFASSDAHERELARQLSMLDLAGGAGAKVPEENAVAEKMLQSALTEMLMD